MDSARSRREAQTRLPGIEANAHVVFEATQIEVVDLDLGRGFSAALVGADTSHDVAVLRIVGPSSDPSSLSPALSTPALPPLESPAGPVEVPVAVLGDSDELRVGEQVRAVGNAGGRGGPPSVAAGHVTALGVSVVTEDDYRKSTRLLHGLIQVSARVQPGDSGGPLFDDQGQVVGMDNATTARTHDHPAMGLALPINAVLHLARRHGWLDSDSAQTQTPEQRGDAPLSAQLDLAPTLDLG